MGQENEPRVLHINTARTWRGGEQQVLYLALELAARHIPQIIVGQPDSELQKRCEFYRIPFHGVSMRGELDFFAVRQLKKVAETFRPNLIHAHTAKAHTLALLFRRKEPGIHVIVSRRVDFHVGGLLSGTKYRSELIDHYIAVSHKVKEILISDGIDETRISVAHSGIDSKRFEELPDCEYLREEFSLKGNEIIFGNVAALVDHKDQTTLLKAFAELKREHADERISACKLFILGEGEKRKILEDLIVTNGLENDVFIPGFREDITAFLNLFNVFVMSSKEEGLGTAVLDAMACSLPVIGTRAGGIPEMIDDQGGILCEAQNPEDMARAMRQMLFDSDLRKAAGNYNLKKVEQFDYRRTAEKTLEIYRNVLN